MNNEKEMLDFCPECGDYLEGNDYTYGCRCCGLVVKRDPVTGKIKSYYDND